MITFIKFNLFVYIPLLILFFILSEIEILFFAKQVYNKSYTKHYKLFNRLSNIIVIYLIGMFLFLFLYIIYSKAYN